MRLRLVTGPWSALYDLPVEAIVEEQDRHRVLGLDPRPPRPVSGAYSRLIKAIEEEPPELGCVLPAGGYPLRLRAILLDLERGLHVDTASLRTVAERLALLVDGQPLRRLGMPVLGAVHGDMAPLQFARILAPCLKGTRLETLFLLAGPTASPGMLRQLRDVFERA